MNFLRKYNMSISCTIVLWVVVTNSFISAQEKDPTYVNYSCLVPENVKVGEQFEISVVFDIQPGWYVYAPIAFNSNQGKIVTKVSFSPPEGIMVLGGLKLPDGGFGTYSGAGIAMTQKFKVAKESTKGKYTIIANILYQTCNDEICYPPVREKIAIPVNVE